MKIIILITIMQLLLKVIVYGATDNVILNFVNSKNTNFNLLTSSVKLTKTQANKIINKREWKSADNLKSTIGEKAFNKIINYIDKNKYGEIVRYCYNRKGKIIGIIKTCIK